MAEIKIPGSLSLVHTPDNAHILKSLPPPAPPPKARSNPIKFTVKTVPTPHNTIYNAKLSVNTTQLTSRKISNSKKEKY